MTSSMIYINEFDEINIDEFNEMTFTEFVEIPSKVKGCGRVANVIFSQ